MVAVHRLQDLGNWEFYEITEDNDASKLCTLSVRYHSEHRQAEYAIWNRIDGDVSATGTVELDDHTDWITVDREPFVRQIINQHPELLSRSSE